MSLEKPFKNPAVSNYLKNKNIKENSEEKIIDINDILSNKKEEQQEVTQIKEEVNVDIELISISQTAHYNGSNFFDISLYDAANISLKYDNAFPRKTIN